MSEATKAQRSALKLSDGVRTYELRFGELGPRDTIAVRKACGWPLARLLGAEQFDADSVLVIWWLARVKNGEQFLTFEAVLNEYPTFEDVERIEVMEVTEGPEPEEADPLDPLPSAGE